MMFGNDGSWAMLTSLATNLGLAVDEDQLFDAERNHGTEMVDYVAISSHGVFSLLDIGS
jgi:hypothetical protein